MRKIYISFIFGLLGLLASPVLALALEFNLGAPVPSEVREWTLLIYVDADNNLEPYALTDLKEMEQGMGIVENKTPGKVEVLVLEDRAKGYSKAMGDWNSARIYRVRPSQHEDAIDSELLLDCGELNMGNPAVLEAFIRAGRSKFPAQKTALVMWDHGAGWVNMANDNDNGTGGKDELLLNELAGTLSRTASLFPEGKLDLIAFDMCLMGQAEVVTACSPFARYMTAGATVLPAVGMDYLNALPLFSQGLETREIVQRMVPIACKGFLKVPWTTASLSAFDLSKADALVSACKGLFSKLRETASSGWSDVTRTLFYTLNYMGVAEYRNKDNALSSIVLLDWLRRLRAMPCSAVLEGEIAAVETAVRSLILNTEAGPDIPLCRGLSLYAPLRRENMRTNYPEMAFDRATGWSETLSQIYAMQDRVKQAPKITSIEIGNPVPRFGVTRPQSGADYDIISSKTFTPLSGTGMAGTQRSYMKVTLEGSNILWAYGYFACSAQKDGNYIVFLEQLLPAERIASNAQESDIGTPVFHDGKNELMYQLSALIYGLSNGETSVPASASAVDIANPNIVTIQGRYTDPRLNGQSIEATLQVDAQSLEIVGLIGTLKDETGRTVVLPVKPIPEGSFQPIFLSIADGGKGKIENVSGSSIQWKNGLSVTVEPLPQGGWLMPLAMAESLGGSGNILLGSPVQIQGNPMVTPFIRDTQVQGISRLPGRYAVMGALPSHSGGYIMAATGAVFDFARSVRGTFDVKSNNQEMRQAEATLRTGGLPILRLTRGQELLDSYFALWTGEIWRLIHCQDGSLLHLIPLDTRHFPEGYLNGEWQGGNGRIAFVNGRISVNGKDMGAYRLEDNVICVEPSSESSGQQGYPQRKGERIFSAYDGETGSLILTFMGTDPIAVIYRRVGNVSMPPAPQPSPRTKPRPRDIFN
ncbi:MAG: hypothetical protein K6E38_02270 [Fretibacterium sp.]|nr:hypothetical protein [Fretibacterium sp.]